MADPSTISEQQATIGKIEKPYLYNLYALTQCIDHLYQDVVKKIDEARATMSERNAIREKYIKKNPTKFVSGMNDVVKFMLAPADQVTQMLDALSAIYPPCGIISKTLAVSLS